MIKMDTVSQSRRFNTYRERPGSDIVKQGNLKKLKTHKKKYFVLRSTSSSGPARLDYYDNEKRFKSSHPPKRSIPLHTCFNINKRLDGRHKFGISVYLDTECFTVLAESEIDQEDWLNLLLEYQNEFLDEGVAPMQHYEYVWQGVIKKKSKTSCTKIEGPYRLCLSNKEVSLVEFEKSHPSYTFQFQSIRRCGHQDNFFFMEVGRGAVTGSGELWLQVDETHTAQAMHDTVLAEMSASRNSQSDFRKRSSTTSSTISHSGDHYIRKRATSESHNQGSPRRNRSMISRPQSSVIYTQRQQNQAHLSVDPVPPHGSSPSAFDHSIFDPMRLRSDSMGSHSSRASRHSDLHESMYENTRPSTPGMSESDSFVNSLPQTPEAIMGMSMGEDHGDGNFSAYLPMTPGQQGSVTPNSMSQRSMTPSPTRGQGGGLMERSGYSSDYLPMTPGHRSSTPSPTRHLERPGSAHSEGQESMGYMDMRPGGSVVSSPANVQDSYMNMTPPAASYAGAMTSGGPANSSGYIVMTPSSAMSVTQGSGYIDMTPGQRTPTDPGPGYVIMDRNSSRMTAPIPIRQKEPGYMDMVPSNQPLPMVKEDGSGEAYLPMHPGNPSPLSSEGLKPAKAVSYLSDDSMSGEFPKRAYSVGSRPPTKTPRFYHHQEMFRRQPLDSSKSSSAPHLIVQKSRSPYIDAVHRNAHLDSYQSSPLSTSVKSDNSDSFMEMECYRPRTASDSYGCRPRSSSFGKQIVQGHRPRSSSYGQSSKGNISKLAAGLRTDSFESMRSQDLQKIRRSQESLGKLSTSSRNSSNESLKKMTDDLHAKKNSNSSDYIDMSFDKRKTPSPNVQGTMSPQPAPNGYVDMTLGTSLPKSSSRGVSPSSSSHSLASSPASSVHSHHEKCHNSTKVIKASGKQIQKQGYKSPISAPAISSENQLKVVTARLKMADKRSPSSSGKESEDESYVSYQPSVTSPIATAPPEEFHYKASAAPPLLQQPPLSTMQDYGSRRNSAMKVHHGYSKSYDSAMRSPEFTTSHLNTDLAQNSQTGVANDKQKPKSDDEGKLEKSAKSKSKIDKGRNRSLKEGKKDSEKRRSFSSKARSFHHSSSSETSLSEMVTRVKSPTLDSRVEFIPDDDLFSNKVFQQKSPEKCHGPADSGLRSSISEMDETAYLDYDPRCASNLPPSEEGKISSIGNNAKFSTKSDDRQRKSLAEREYCEIDFPAKDDTKKPESDYIEADPAPLKEILHKESSLKSKRSKSPSQYSDFSYMDFDPAMENSGNDAQGNKAEVKAPHRVQSFISFTSLEESIDEPDQKVDKPETAKTSQNVNSGSRSEKDCSETLCDRPGTKNDKKEQWCSEEDNEKNSADKNCNKESSVQSSKKSRTKSESCAPRSMSASRCSYGNDTDEKVKVRGQDAKPVISKRLSQDESLSKQGSFDLGGEKSSSTDNLGSVKVCKLDKSHSKIVIKSTMPARSDNQPVEDEGYCDLDFRPNASPSSVGMTAPVLPPATSTKRHHRSGSTSSSNSDRSRRLTSEDDVPDLLRTADGIPIPETAICYVSDEPFCSSVGSCKDVSSPSKQSLGLRRSSPGTPGAGMQALAKNVDFRSSLPSKGYSSSNNGQTGSAISRQTSVPVGPLKSPRTSGDIPTGRNRTPSGPAGITSSAKIGSENGGKFSAQSSLEPAISNLDQLQKQKSMPCMNIALPFLDKKPADPLQDIGGQSRHSYPDLSAYEEMSFPGNNIAKGSQSKSNSQQHLESYDCDTLQYAELDLKNSTENIDDKLRIKSRHPSSVDDISQGSVPYAQIDYQKTESLKQQNQAAEKENVKFTIT